MREEMSELFARHNLGEGGSDGPAANKTSAA